MKLTQPQGDTLDALYQVSRNAIGYVWIASISRARRDYWPHSHWQIRPVLRALVSKGLVTSHGKYEDLYALTAAGERIAAERSA